MWKRSTLLLGSAGLFAATLPKHHIGQISIGHMAPADVFAQIQLGSIPPVKQIRSFLLVHFQEELNEMEYTEAKVNAMDTRKAHKVLKQVLFDRFLTLPFRCFTFDIEFTGVPRFTAKGATEDICEIAFYHPHSNECFTKLVHPLHGAKMTESASKITGITDALLEKHGKPFDVVWKDAMKFLSKPRDGELEGSGANILLLSHGGKLSDVSMLQKSLSSIRQDMPRAFEFGDTYHIMRDLHRKRPVTSDKRPPSWGLEDAASWLNLDIQKEISPTGVAPNKDRKLHRAEPDARLTWATLHHTLDRYGDDSLTPHQQLVQRFYDTAQRRARQQRDARRAPVISKPSGFEDEAYEEL